MLPYGEIVNRHALTYDLRPDVVMCIIIQESRGNPYAQRFEKGIASQLAPRKREELSGWQPKANTNDPSLDTEKNQRSCSWGPMQCLGETVRWCAKYRGPFLGAISEPELGVEIGCKILSFYLKRANGDYRAALKGYNGTWKYADEVLKRASDGEHKEWFH